MARMRPVEMLPTLVTLGNLFSGFLAIAYLTDALHLPVTERIALYEKCVFLIFLAMFFDAIDGKVARMVGHASDFGAQVDSICDAVSFGAAPALLFKVLVEAEPQVIKPKLALVLAILFLACAVLRLARFNLETEQDEDSHQMFEGLPTPAAAAIVAGMSYLAVTIDPLHGDSWPRDVMPYVIPIVAFLMVSRLPYVHGASWLFRRKTFPALVALVFAAFVVVLQPEALIPVICLGYMVSGPVLWLIRRLRGRRDEPVI